jgi:hypothetical protein
VSFHTGDTSTWTDASLTPPGERIYTAAEHRLFPDAEGLGRRRRIEVAADIVGYDDQRRWHERHLPGACAFAMIGAARFDDVWRSVAACCASATWSGCTGAPTTTPTGWPSSGCTATS